MSVLEIFAKLYFRQCMIFHKTQFFSHQQAKSQNKVTRFLGKSHQIISKARDFNNISIVKAVSI